MTCPDPLTPWQQAQAALLTCFASTSYLQSLLDLTVALGDGAFLVMSRQRREDGSRRLAWQGHDWMCLREIAAWTRKSLALRKQGIYRGSAVSGRLMHAHMTVREYMGAEEVDAFDAVADLVGDLARPIDMTVAPGIQRGWDDHSLTMEIDRPKPPGRTVACFVPDTAVACVSGDKVPRTGVYMAAGDPHAILQFAWCGKDAPPMPMASTFSALGLEALDTVGRGRLWRDHAAMLAFVEQPHVARRIRDESWWRDRDTEGVPALLLLPHVFVTRPANWVLVEAAG